MRRENSLVGARASLAAWERRILRARLLSAAHPAAADVLDFYAVLAATQESLLDTHAHAIRSGEAFSTALDLGVAAGAMPALLATVARIAPPPLAAAAEEMTRAGSEAQRALVLRYWVEREAPDPARALLAEALLQPFAEAVAEQARSDAPPPRAHEAPAACPICAGQPVAGVLRDASQGAKRSLVCGFCLTEWAVPRIACAACGEMQFERLAAFCADAFPAARVDACESCRAYVKTIDLTRDGTAIPVVDDLATLPLDLWAREQRYRRIRPNVLRL